MTDASTSFASRIVADGGVEARDRFRWYETRIPLPEDIGPSRREQFALDYRGLNVPAAGVAPGPSDLTR